MRANVTVKRHDGTLDERGTDDRTTLARWFATIVSDPRTEWVRVELPS